MFQSRPIRSNQLMLWKVRYEAWPVICTVEFVLRCLEWSACYVMWTKLHSLLTVMILVASWDKWKDLDCRVMLDGRRGMGKKLIYEGGFLVLQQMYLYEVVFLRSSQRLHCVVVSSLWYSVCHHSNSSDTVFEVCLKVMHLNGFVSCGLLILINHLSSYRQ